MTRRFHYKLLWMAYFSGISILLFSVRDFGDQAFGLMLVKLGDCSDDTGLTWEELILGRFVSARTRRLLKRLSTNAWSGDMYLESGKDRIRWHHICRGHCYPVVPSLDWSCLIPCSMSIERFVTASKLQRANSFIQQIVIYTAALQGNRHNKRECFRRSDFRTSHWSELANWMHTLNYTRFIRSLCFFIVWILKTSTDSVCQLLSLSLVVSVVVIDTSVCHGSCYWNFIFSFYQSKQIWIIERCLVKRVDWEPISIFEVMFSSSLFSRSFLRSGWRRFGAIWSKLIASLSEVIHGISGTLQWKVVRRLDGTRGRDNEIGVLLCKYMSCKQLPQLQVSSSCGLLSCW